MPTALNISILEALALLDGTFKEFSEGVAEDSYAVWLGAGISLGKLPGLEVIAEDVLEHLRVRINAAHPACQWRDSLDRILGLIGLTDDDWKAIDYAMPVATWRDLKSIRTRLVVQYARMLDQNPTGEPADYLLWTAVEVVARYANPAITPGAEHLGLAALIIEGVASDTASANWDGLVEKAVEVLVGVTAPVLQPRVLPVDVQKNLSRARLYKFHGCAVLAGINQSNYRGRLVGRASQIHGWAEKPENKVIAGKLLDLAISKPTLMLGLSAQDTNIQGVFVAAQAQLPATFPSHPPGVVLSEDRVGADQRSLLRNFYKDDYEAKAAAIEESALLPAYAQSLLPALWLHVVCAKLSAFIALAAPGISGAEQDDLRSALKLLRDAGAATAHPNKHEQFILQALAVAGRAMSLFRDGHVPTTGAGVYSPVTVSAVTRSLGDPALPSSGLPQLALGIALLGRGQAEGLWTCAVTDPADPKSGAASVTSVVRAAEVFFAASGQAAARLALAGHVAQDDKAVIIHSHEVMASAPRHPSAPPGRTGKMGLREFSVSSLADGAVSLDVLMKEFKAEMGL